MNHCLSLHDEGYQENGHSHGSGLAGALDEVYLKYIEVWVATSEMLFGLTRLNLFALLNDQLPCSLRKLSPELIRDKNLGRFLRFWRIKKNRKIEYGEGSSSSYQVGCLTQGQNQIHKMNQLVEKSKPVFSCVL